MFTTLIVQPIFNLLVFIYAIIPGHNFGLAIILFTIVIRLLLWPLVKKQLHQAKKMRELQPELKRIKKEAKGDRQKESVMLMELYKERGVNPFGSIGVVLLQLPIFIGLYSGLNKLIGDPHSIVSFSYPALQNLPWLQTLSHDISKFDDTLFGVVDLTRSALSAHGTYWPAMIIVLGSAVVQFLTTKQLMPQDKKARKLRDILRGASDGQRADQSEVNAAVSRSTMYIIPVMIFIFTVNIASALSLYWLTGGLVALIQQSRVLRRDETEMEALADKSDKPNSKDLSKIAEAEVVTQPKPKKPSSKKSKAKKRRKR